MFLAKTDFIVEVSFDRQKQPSGYEPFLKGLQSLGKTDVRMIKSITIASKFERNGPSAAANDLTQLFDYWNWFVPELISLGLQGSQLKWPGICPLLCHPRPGELLQQSDVWQAWRRRVAEQTNHHTWHLPFQITQMTIFYHGIVEPTLREHGCWSPIPNVLKQAYDLKLINYDQDIRRNQVVQSWKLLNNKRWEMKYGAVAKADEFEDLDRGPGEQSYLGGQKRDAYRDWQHSWHEKGDLVLEDDGW